VTAMAFEAAAAEWEIPETARQWETPGPLAAAIDPATVQTPALDLIDEAIAWAYTTLGARLLISLPPQEGKSSRVTKFGSLWALGQDPERRIGIASYAQSLAEGFGREVRNTITTFNGDEDTLDLGLRVAPDYGSARRWQLDGHRGGVVCVGIGSGLTGRPLDALVIDDPFADAVQAGSAYYRGRVWDWWQSVGSPRLAPGAPVIVILTRWHEDDLAGRLVKAEDGHRWRVINIPALADHDPGKGQTDPLGREPGEWLQSARGRTAAEWEQIRISVGSRVFTALYQGRPSPDAGNVWQRQWWRRYQVPLWSQHPTVPGAYLVRDVDELIMSWDMAFKDTKGSDFVVGQVWARRGADVFLLDQVHKRLSFTDTLIAFAALVARWPQATAKYVEDKANGTAVISTLRTKVPGLLPVNPTDSKYGRATAVAPFVEAGNVFLPDKLIALFDADALIDEAAGFPNGAHDDQVDATSQALAELLLDGNGAQAWIAWAKRKAEEATAGPAAEVAPEAAEPPEKPPPAVFSAAQERDARALIGRGGIAAAGEPGVFAVAGSRSRRYLVTAGSCECPAGVRMRPCKHRLAVIILTAAPAAEVPRATPGPPEDSAPQLSLQDAADARKQARDAAWRQQRTGW
jgi:predicted phage terminase large subunit-like protein